MNRYATQHYSIACTVVSIHTVPQDGEFAMPVEPLTDLQLTVFCHQLCFVNVRTLCMWTLITMTMTHMTITFPVQASLEANRLEQLASIKYPQSFQRSASVYGKRH